MCSKDIRTLTVVMKWKTTEQITELKCLGNNISEFKKGVQYPLQIYYTMNGTIKTNVSKQIITQTKQRIRNIT
jgi:hypothetical protein